MTSFLDHRLRPAVAVPLLVLLALVPTIAGALGEDFYVGVASRVSIFLWCFFCGLSNVTSVKTGLSSTR